MKKVTLLLSLFFTLQLNAQWDSCGITANVNNPYIEAIDAFIIHQGRLISHNFFDGLQFSDDNGQSWDTLPQSGMSGTPIEFYEFDQKLYASTMVNGTAGGVQYYSTDKGLSWTTDSAGMPGSAVNANYKASVLKAQQFGDYLFYKFNIPNPYYWRHKDSTVYHADQFANSNFMNDFTIENDTIWTAMGGSFYYLDQARGSYQQPANNNLGFAIGTAVAKSDANIFMISRDSNLDWILFRSQDYGNNWDTLYMQNILGQGTFTARSINSIYIDGTELWLGAGPKGTNEKVEILYSSDLGNSWTYQNQNLPTDPNGTNSVQRFYPAGGYLFAHLSFKDVYRMARNVGLNENNHAQLDLYPNPSEDYFSLESSKEIMSVKLMDLRGNTLEHYHAMRRYSIKKLPAGLYLVQVYFNDGESLQKQILVF